MNTFTRIITSRKVWVALAGVVLAVTATLGLPDEKVGPVVAAIVALAGVVIAATGYEDAAQKSAGRPEDRK